MRGILPLDLMLRLGDYLPTCCHVSRHLLTRTMHRQITQTAGLLHVVLYIREWWDGEGDATECSQNARSIRPCTYQFSTHVWPVCICVYMCVGAHPVGFLWCQLRYLHMTCLIIRLKLQHRKAFRRRAYVREE